MDVREHSAEQRRPCEGGFAGAAVAGPQLPAHSFFQNRDCEFFPCHEGVEPDRFNCMLCYCPLYALGPRCGGAYSYTAKGVKDCSACLVPHEGTRGIGEVAARFGQLADLAREHGDEES